MTQTSRRKSRSGIKSATWAVAGASVVKLSVYIPVISPVVSHPWQPAILPLLLPCRGRLLVRKNGWCPMTSTITTNTTNSATYTNETDRRQKHEQPPIHPFVSSARADETNNDPKTATPARRPLTDRRASPSALRPRSRGCTDLVDGNSLGPATGVCVRAGWVDWCRASSRAKVASKPRDVGTLPVPSCGSCARRVPNLPVVNGSLEWCDGVAFGVGVVVVVGGGDVDRTRNAPGHARR
ncbi:uncharacterized protein J3D65DRAFT_423507 [Phyllosticta citribraziliensis]|uniref:Uncharacterized protein n=1 Tax=Phyllosticta citribraziliensis TaxID=989973 RepID=A0ABR1LHT8_9PEZI